MPLVVFVRPSGVVPLYILGLGLHWTSALRGRMTSRAADCTSAWLLPWIMLGAINYALESILLASSSHRMVLAILISRLFQIPAFLYPS